MSKATRYVLFEKYTPELAARNFFRQILQELVEKGNNEFPKNIYFFKDNRVFMVFETKTQTLGVCKDAIYSKILIELGSKFDKEPTENIIKNFVKHHFKKDVLIIKTFNNFNITGPYFNIL